MWNHRPDGAHRLAAALAGEGFNAHVVTRLEDGVRDADIISCATLSDAPLVAGAWLSGGQHLDLVGAFSMRMREADDAALKRARIFVDTAAAMSEGGDVALGLKAGAITRADIAGDLAALVRGAPGAAASQRDHPVQIRRRGDRGPRRGDAGVASGRAGAEPSLRHGRHSIFAKSPVSSPFAAFAAAHSVDGGMHERAGTTFRTGLGETVSSAARPSRNPLSAATGSR